MSHSPDTDLVGVFEVCAMLELSRGALHARRRQSDFPQPVAALRAGPIWTRAQIVEYARDRCRRLVERRGVVAAAEEASPAAVTGGAVPVEEAARILGVSPAQLEHVALTYPGLGNWHVKTGRLLSVERDQLALFGRPLGRPAERAVLAWPE